MTFGRGEVEQAALGEHVDGASVAQPVRLHERARRGDLDRQVVDRGEVDLVVEVPAVGDDRAVLEALDGAAVDHVDVTGHGDHDVGVRRRLRERHHAVAVHHRLERARRIDLGDDDMRAEPGRTAGETATAPTVAADDKRLAREQHVGRPDQPVDGALPGAVAVVEEVLGERLVDRDDRKAQRAVARHGAQPDHAGGRLLGAGDHVLEQLAATLVQLRDEVGAVVHRDLRARVEHRLDVSVIARGVLALDGERRDPVLARERRGHGILRGQRIARAEADLGAARLEGDREVCGLAGDVQACAETQTLERPLARESLADDAQHRHLARRPIDEALPFAGQARVGDIGLRHFQHVGHAIPPSVFVRNSAVYGRPPSAADPPSALNSIKNANPTISPPRRSTSAAAAPAVPPVASRSSTISTRWPGWIASACISTTASPYSSV